MGNTQTSVVTEKDENRKVEKWECPDCFTLNKKESETCNECSAPFNEQAVWPCVTVEQVLFYTEKDIIRWTNSDQCSKVIDEWYQLFNTQMYYSKIFTPIVSNVWVQMGIARKSMLVMKNIMKINMVNFNSIDSNIVDKISSETVKYLHCKDMQNLIKSIE